MEQFFVFLYPVVVLVSIIGYIPQIKELIFAKQPLKGISISSWLIWLLSSGLSLGYGVFHLHDLMFCLTTGVATLLIAGTTALILYNRYFQFADKAELVEKVEVVKDVLLKDVIEKEMA